MRRTSSRGSIRLTPRSKWKMHQNYWKFQNRNVQIFGYVCQNTHGPNHGPVWKIQWFFLNKFCTDMFVHRKTRIILFGIRWRHKNGWKEAEYGSHKEEIDEKCWSWWTNIISWPAVFGMHSNVNASRTNSFLMNTGKMFESRISAGATEKLPEWEKPYAKTVAWSHDMEGHAQKCVERCCELANKKTERLYKVPSPCLDDHHFKKEELESVGKLSKRVILISVCGWHQVGWKETKQWSDVESTKQRSWFGRTNIFPGSCLFGLHSKRMSD